MINENEDAHRDGAVRDIERRPMQAPQIEIEEIDHFFEPQSVDQVADGSPADKRQTDVHPRITGGEFYVKITDKTYRRDRGTNKQNEAQLGTVSRQKAECPARIANVGDVE